MLFHITQTHTPESCPKDADGSKTLYDPRVGVVKLWAWCGVFAQRVISYIVEAASLKAIYKFLAPGSKRCTATITSVSEEPIVR